MRNEAGDKNVVNYGELRVSENFKRTPLILPSPNILGKKSSAPPRVTCLWVFFIRVLTRQVCTLKALPRNLTVRLSYHSNNNHDLGTIRKCWAWGVQVSFLSFCFGHKKQHKVCWVIDRAWERVCVHRLDTRAPVYGCVATTNLF